MKTLTPQTVQTGLAYRTGNRANNIAETTYQTAYAMVMAMTDRQARHYAVDIDSLAAARKSQRKFAGRVNALAKLLGREFAGCVMTDGVSGLGTDPAVSYSRMRVTLWIVRDGTILRTIIVHGCDRHVMVRAVQTAFPHPGCRHDEGALAAIQAPSSTYTMAPAARMIVRTPQVIYKSQNEN